MAGAGLALATQGVLSNLVAGLSIIFSKPFRVGEYISIVASRHRGDGASRAVRRPERAPGRAGSIEGAHARGRLTVDVGEGAA